MKKNFLENYIQGHYIPPPKDILIRPLPKDPMITPVSECFSCWKVFKKFVIAKILQIKNYKKIAI